MAILRSLSLLISIGLGLSWASSPTTGLGLPRPFGPEPSQSGPENLARSATASASESQSAVFGPDKAIDGDANSRWSGIPGHNAGVWFELDWPRPVTVAEVLVRQYERYAEEWDLETWDETRQTWVNRGHFGHAGERLPIAVLARFAPTVTSRVRIANITHGPSFTEVEAYANEKAFPPAIAVASDLLGNYVGMLTDSLGAAPVVGERIVFRSGGAAVETKTDEHGLFRLPMRIGERNPVAVETGDGIRTTLDPTAFQYGLTPMSDGQARRSLDGQWRFAVAPPDGFWRPDFDDSAWSKIAVPGHWEMQGFRALDGIGGYRRSFAAPTGTGRLKLRFDGVYSGAEVWVNGRRVAAHEGGFTPFEADITDAVHPGQNVLAVRVSEHTNVSDNLDKMSQYADFPLSGITRKVYLFRVPETHVSRYTVAAHFDQATHSAFLDTSVFAIREGAGGPAPCEVLATLWTANGALAAQTVSPVKLLIPGDGFHQGSAEFRLRVPGPQGWTAESPYLYRLTLDLRRGGETVQHLEEKVGLRETTIRGSQILINGSPVKFRGTCHHDQDPLMGRAVTVERTREDLRMIKEANLNALRTSHYPPIPELLDIADSLGLYVEDEADFCWVGVADDLRNAPRILQLTAELVARDRNHPSVFMWSLCNESSFGYDFERSHEWVLRNEPTRPNGAATSAWLEIATYHNPISLARMKETEGLDKPLLFDESLCIYQGIWRDVYEMWTDPGIRDYYIVPLPAIYRAFMDSKVTQGSQIWAWSDDIFCVPGRGLEYGRESTMNHLIDAEYTLPGRGLVGDAPWGVVDGWRRRKPEFWLTKKLHSPVKIAEGKLPMPAAGDPIRVAVENQYDFTNLSALRATYTLGDETGTARVDVAPHERGFVSVAPRHQVRRGETLELRFRLASGMLVDAYRLPVGEAPPVATSARAYRPLVEREVSFLAGNALDIIGEGFEVEFDRASGALRRCVSGGSPTLLELPSLHVLPTDSPTGPTPKRTEWTLKSFVTSRDGKRVNVTLAGSYPMFDGEYQVGIEPSGEMTVHSSFRYTGPDRLAREIGLGFSVPRTCDTLHWERNAEWSVYPDDHIGRPVGTARAFASHGTTVPPTWAWSQDNSAMGTNDFRSTKRNIRSAWIGYPSGPAVSIESDGQQSLRAFVDTDRISVNVSDWYGGTNVGLGEWTTNYGQGKVVHTGDVLESTVHLRLVR